MLPARLFRHRRPVANRITEDFRRAIARVIGQLTCL